LEGKAESSAHRGEIQLFRRAVPSDGYQIEVYWE
jgi:hypothetical protein